MLSELAETENYDITLFGEDVPMAAAVRILVEKSNDYKNNISRNNISIHDALNQDETK